MKTLIYQQARSVRLANGDTANFETPIIAPAIGDRVGFQGAVLDSFTVDRPVVVWNIVPNSALPQLNATLQTTRYAVQGGWDSASFLAAFPTGTVNVSGAMVQNRGVVSHDAEFDGVFSDRLQVTNLTGGALTLQCIVSVFTRLNNAE